MGFLGFLGAFVQYTALDAVVPCNSVCGFLRFLDHIYIYIYIHMYVTESVCDFSTEYSLIVRDAVLVFVGFPGLFCNS